MSEVIVNSYTRRDILRILRIHAQQLRAWERAGIFPHIETYSFEHLVQLRKLRDLCSTRLSASHIRASIQAMQQASGMSNPLLEAGTARDGARVVFRHSGTLMDPIGGQLLFDFEHGADVAREDGHRFRREPAPHTPAAFLEAVQCEEAGNIDEAVALYEAILAQAPGHAPSAINLGTIYYHRKDYARAERLYRGATEADPNYALAFFDLGNVLDELQRMTEAIEAYQAAIRLVPRYADAHYNLALAYERQGERRQALRHWTAYIKLDPHGPWHNHARLQIRKLLDREKLKIVARRSSSSK
ncbi:MULTISPECIES: tetratricopeptide repeat protein [Acidobacterium]|uniref:Tetratricopeptide repeat protein n=1 Tax=Acidobacterium capsulatum (strain ATCC 51196 / DSM 11244 / BCRC 80197 / JCM 7670 / NBRC 15755 / NCIMB 13165 / 161) TaxID=240015 RepID=C1F8B1_ACIC5|nr:MULTISPECIES: tetratricopeptide repeat protein [Acidobacterium]ACO34638.1 tetratricopeptide repeat protein [Acidobacterium capsulatum ATCC 51196]